MTAFDSANHSPVTIWFDSDGEEVAVGIFTDTDEAHAVLHFEQIPAIISDLLDAYALRGGDVPGAMERFAEERGL